MKNEIKDKKQERKEGEFLLGTVDCMFKAILLDPNNPDYIKGLIHHITKISYKDLENMSIENSEYVINHHKDKKMRSDIIVSVDKSFINIEMDRGYYDGVFEKNEAYYHKQYASIYNSSEDYKNSKTLIQICFEDFYRFKEDKEIYKFLYKEIETNEILNEREIKYFINLAYIYDKCYNKNVDELTEFEKYCLLLKTVNKDKSYEISGDDIVMKKVSERIEDLSKDKKIIGLYDAEVEEEKIKRTQILYAEERGEKRGIEKGIKQGIEQGIERGIEQGIEQNKHEIVKNMLKENIDVSIISKITGLTIEEIEKIR